MSAKICYSGSIVTKYTFRHYCFRNSSIREIARVSSVQDSVSFFPRTSKAAIDISRKNQEKKLKADWCENYVISWNISKGTAFLLQGLTKNESRQNNMTSLKLQGIQHNIMTHNIRLSETKGALKFEIEINVMKRWRI